MKAIGLDIGTTTICAVVMDGNTGEILEIRTMPNSSNIDSGKGWEKLQNPSLIINQIEDIVNGLTINHPTVSCIGLTGQMHGIVYVDEKGDAVSPLYTWQDGRGNLEYKDGMTYAEYLSEKTGYKLSTGFGVVTHFYNSVNGLVPDCAKYFCTIQDYVAMKLSETQKPLLHPTNAASLGCFNMSSSEFDHQAAAGADVSDAFFPNVLPRAEVLGKYRSGISVAAAIGDNQASFIGSVNSRDECLLVNIGTGSQISLFTGNYIMSPHIETRPFTEDGFLLVGSSLCGGRAYALLERFFRSVVEMAAGMKFPELYGLMDKLADSFLTEENGLQISTKFSGTRDNPSLRGFIGNIGMDNFTPGHFVVGVLEGIVRELYELYEMMISQISRVPKKLIGSGNGIRLNVSLQKLIQKIFNMPISIPLYKEEAAYGAALFSLAASGYFKDIREAQTFVRYE